MALALGRFDNIDVFCVDVERMADFYHGTLGLPLLFEREPGWFAVQAGDVTLYFFPGEGEHPRLYGDDPDHAPPGFESFSFEVADLDAAIAELDGQVQWTGDGPRDWHHPSGTWYRFRSFFDPEGNKIYITEPHKAG